MRQAMAKARRWRSTVVYDYRGRALYGAYRVGVPRLSGWARRQLENRSYQHPLVPIDELEDVFVTALDWLTEQRGEVDGDYLEFGVSTGSSMIALHRALRRRPGSTLRLVGFDSFEGLPADARHDDGGVWRAGAFMADENRTRRRLVEAGVSEEQLELVVGWFRDTLTDERRGQLGPVPLVLVDCDLYAASREALDFFVPLIDGPTVIVFDDWNSADLADRGLGQARAWRETLEAHPDLTEVGRIDPYNDNSHIVLVTRP